MTKNYSTLNKEINSQPYDKDWYKKLKKSKITPPSYVFGIVWPILYLLLIIFFLFAYKNREYKALSFFVIQLALNLSWTTIFFRYRKLKIGLGLIILIILLTLITILYLNNINIAIFLIPYLLWLTLATYLNFYIVLNN